MLGSPGDAVSDAAFISIDRLGTDVRVRQGTDYSVQRIGFEQVRTLCPNSPSRPDPFRCHVLSQAQARVSPTRDFRELRSLETMRLQYAADAQGLCAPRLWCPL